MRRITSIIALSAFAMACQGRSTPPPTPTPAASTPAPTPVPAPAVGAITLGSELAADKTVAAPKEAFAVKDKIYASVATTGSGKFKLRAVWTYTKGDKTTQVNETTMEFDATGPATNEFHIENTKPWPKGDYKVDIYLNDGAEPAASKTFKIE
jgi:hypothetical protein